MGIVGRDSSVGIATRCGLGGRGTNPSGDDFPHQSRPAPALPSLPYNGYQVIPGVEAVGAWRWPPTPI
jgi:hypothetical protein